MYVIIISRHAYEVSEAGIVIDLFISRHAYEVSEEAGFVFDLFLIIILIILNLPLEACMRCISGTAWS